MGQRAADGRLAGAGRAGQQHAALGAQGQLLGQRVVLQRRDDVRLQAVDQVVEPAEIFQRDSLHLFQIDVAGEVVAAQDVDILVGGDAFMVANDRTDGAHLVDIKLAREAKDMVEIDGRRQMHGQEAVAEVLVVAGGEGRDLL